MPRPPPTAPTGSAQPRASLTERDLEVLHHLAAGRSTAGIAAAMSISTNTVRTRIHRLQNRLDVPARAQLVSRARSFGLLEGGDDPARSEDAIPGQRRGEHDS